MANVGPHVWYLNSVAWTAVTAWPISTLVTAGELVRQNATPSLNIERVFVCIVAGLTGGTEPSWGATATKGEIFTDNAASWQECTGQPGVNGDTTNSPTWTQNKNNAVTIGLIIYDSVSGSLQIVSTAGTTGNGSQPTFSATAGVTTTDNTVTWTSLGAATNFGSWAAPSPRLSVVNTANWMAAGDTCYISDNHAETTSSGNQTYTLTGSSASPSSYYCIDHTVSLPPSSSNLTTTATISTTGTTSQSIAGGPAYMYGVIFQCAVTGGSNQGINLDAQGTFEACAFKKFAATGTSAAIGFTGASLDLINCVVRFAATGDQIRLGGAVGAANIYRWRNTLNAIDTGGTIPTLLFGGTVSCGHLTLDGLDLSAFTGTVFSGTAYMGYIMENCALGSGAVISQAPTTRTPWSYDGILSDSTGTTYQHQRGAYQGTLTASIGVYRTGGASNGVVDFSWNLANNANALFLSPFEAPPIAIWNTTLSTNRVVTIYGIVNAASVPNNDQIWLDVYYLGSSSSPLTSHATSRKANGLAAGTALTADSTSVWNAAARANSTVYSVGATIQATGSGGQMVFFCTTGGTSASSLPGAYASAVDGGSVTDGTAVFRAACRYSIAITLSSPQPALVGDIIGVVRAGGASTTFYVDPLLNLS